MLTWSLRVGARAPLPRAPAGDWTARGEALRPHLKEECRGLQSIHLPSWRHLMTSPGVQGEVNSLHGRILEKDSATFNGKKNSLFFTYFCHLEYWWLLPRCAAKCPALPEGVPLVLSFLTVLTKPSSRAASYPNPIPHVHITSSESEGTSLRTHQNNDLDFKK